MTDEHQEHLDAAVIADLDAGVLAAAPTKAAEEHLGACLVCQQVRSDLAELPSMLAAIPAPAVPAEVAARLDAALERAAQDRAAREQRTATVPVLWSRRRRFLMPLAAAAAVVAAVGFLIPELDLGSSNTSDDSTSAGGAATFVEGGAAGDAVESAGRLAELSSDSFGGDVATEVYKKSTAPSDAGLSTSARDEQLSAFLDRSGCTPSPTPAGARLQSALLDERRAILLSYGPRSRRVAVAYTCVDGRPVVQARAVLDLR